MSLSVPALLASDVRLTYANGVRALDGLSLSAARGEFVSIIGPNGSGKSTLLRALAGLQRADSGTLQIEGVPAMSLDSRERARRLALVPQALDVLPGYSAEDFVLMGRYAHLRGWRQYSREDRQRARAELARVDALEFKDRCMNELSGGERQRVLAARALAQEAGIILLDEPTSALDLKHQLAIFSLIRRLCREGPKTIVAVTHDLNLASQFSDRVILVQAGRVIESGLPEEVLRPATLEKVYEAPLACGLFTSTVAGPSRPWVLPWARPE